MKSRYTSGYEGFYHLIHIDGGVEECQMEYIIRDHDRTRFEKKKETFINICNKLNDKYGYDCFSVDITDQYYNMKEKLEPYMFLIDNAKKVMKDLGVVPVIQPIRGGTDGARLSFMGIPCPNLCAGGHNFHGKYEYCSIQSMEKIVEILTGLAVIRYK
jgi:tripeptide aminopeptidase